MTVPDALNCPALPEWQHPDQSLISIRNVTMRFPVAKRYREWVISPFTPRRVYTALSNATLGIRAGDRVAIMGPNGAGKTTLLRLIGGLLLPTEGEIVVNGFSTVHHNSAARRSVGFVFNEERSFFWRLTGAQNLEFFGALDNLSGRRRRYRIRELIRLVGLEDAADKPVSVYSSGMKQRLALARGLIAEPEVLILDEPTRALDPVACDEMIDLIMREIYHGSRKTLLIATHRPEEAKKLCNKLMIVGAGRIKTFDSIEELAASGTTISEYYRRSVALEQA